jgi:hypothetical protein
MEHERRLVPVGAYLERDGTRNSHFDLGKWGHKNGDRLHALGSVPHDCDTIQGKEVWLLQAVNYCPFP